MEGVDFIYVAALVANHQRNEPDLFITKILAWHGFGRWQVKNYGKNLTSILIVCEETRHTPPAQMYLC